jgi:hypothetical protein
MEQMAQIAWWPVVSSWIVMPWKMTLPSIRWVLQLILMKFFPNLTKKWNTGFQQNQVISIYHIKCAQNFHKLYMAQLMEQQGSCRAWLIDKPNIGQNVHPTISYLKYSVRAAWVFCERGWKIYECPKCSSHSQLLSVKQWLYIYVLGLGVSLQTMAPFTQLDLHPWASSI